MINRRRVLSALALVLTISCALQPVLGQNGSGIIDIDGNPASGGGAPSSSN